MFIVMAENKSYSLNNVRFENTKIMSLSGVYSNPVLA